MSKSKILGMMALIAFAVGIILPGTVQPVLGDEIQIGFIAPVTGAWADFGAVINKATKLALKQINEGGGINGKKINLINEDNQSSDPGALGALNKLVEQDKVLVILGTVKSSETLTISDSIKKYGIPTMVGGTNITLTRRGNPWLFRCRPDDSITAAAMVKYIKEDLKLTKVGILHVTDAFGTGGADLVEQGCKEKGLTLVKREKYAAEDKDFTDQLLSLKNAGTQVMCLYGHGDDTAIIMKQYRNLGSPFKYIGSPSSAMPGTLEAAGGAGEGLLAIMDYVPGETKESKKYIDDYRREYGAEMDSQSAWNYDALCILANAIRKAGEDRAEIREAILALKDYKGVCGTYSFTRNGDGLHEVSIIQNQKGGTYKLLKVLKIPPKD
jgi:branched-chain amino acid transport system substrate-binding protein